MLIVKKLCEIRGSCSSYLLFSGPWTLGRDILPQQGTPFKSERNILWVLLGFWSFSHRIKHYYIVGKSYTVKPKLLLLPCFFPMAFQMGFPIIHVTRVRNKQDVKVMKSCTTVCQESPLFSIPLSPGTLWIVNFQNKCYHSNMSQMCQALYIHDPI